MTPQRRTALVSVVAAVVLVVVKLATGLATHSLGLVSEAMHSGTDLVAALLTFFAVGVAARPADVGAPVRARQGRASGGARRSGDPRPREPLLAFRAIMQLSGSTSSHVRVTWYAFAVLIAVIVIDASRSIVSWRAAKKFGSAALKSNALHFASDLLGSWAVLVGLVLVRAGYAPPTPWRRSSSASSCFSPRRA